MKIDFNKYKSIIFDCDGVILNSNKIKSLAFYETVLPYGINYANQFYSYHLENGGISRYNKFEFFINKILPNSFNIDINQLIFKFSALIKEKLVKCEVMCDIEKIRYYTMNSNWSVVSGGDEIELNYIFKIKNIDLFFNDGIFGSPLDKFQIINKCIYNGKYSSNVLFIGDSRLDYEVAKYFNFDFIFVSQWTEFKNWHKFCIDYNIQYVHEPSNLLYP